MYLAKRLLALAAILVVANRIEAQSFRIGDTTYTLSKVTGNLASVGSGAITVKTGLQSMQLVISDQKLAELRRPVQQPTDPPTKTQVVVTGSADPSFLARDQYATFTAELKAGKGVEAVTELTLFTPSETQTLGLVSTTGGELPTVGQPSGTFLISGQIASFGKGQLTVIVPNEKGRNIKVSVAVSDSATISIRSADLNYAQVGDLVSAEGYVATRLGQPMANSMLVLSVEVTLAKPLMGKGKRREQAMASRSADRRNPKAAAKIPPKANKPVPDAGAELAEDEPESGPGKLDNAGGKPNEVHRRTNDPSPDELIIVDAFIVDEGSAFDEDAEMPKDN